MRNPIRNELLCTSPDDLKSRGRRRRRETQIGVAMAIAICVSMGVGCNSAPGGSAAAAREQNPASAAPSVDTMKVALRPVNFVVSLPGELEPYEAVSIYPKVTGFVKSISVDRGSHVQEGQVLARLEAPEIVAQKAAAEAKLESVQNQQIETRSKLAGDQDAYQRLKIASATPGVISDNELEIAQKVAEADNARVIELGNTAEAARAALHSAEVMEGYLRITAPFTGIVTLRNVHPGALVGPAGGGNQVAMLRVEQISRLRLVVAVPEKYVAGVIPGAKVNFSVSAFPNQNFSGTVARVSDSLDPNTRTMPVELDVPNPNWALAPGMFPSVSWPVRRSQPSLWVPQSSVIRTMKGSYIIRVRNGLTDWVSIKQGVNSDSDVEVFGELHAGDQVVLQASEELRPNTRVTVSTSGGGQP
ncbi:MAG: efflux RND transporter periplasmic adaptor subunit [Candidatus Acidiferrales bacterium]